MFRKVIVNDDIKTVLVEASARTVERFKWLRRMKWGDASLRTGFTVTLRALFGWMILERQLNLNDVEKWIHDEVLETNP